MNAPSVPPLPAPSDMASTSTDALAQALRAAAAGPGISPALHALLLRAGDALDGAQAAIEAGNLRYRALFDAVPDPVSVLARDGTVLDLNKAGMRAYKRPREDIIGQPIEVLNPDLPRDHLVPVLETLDRGETYVIEVTNMRADGTRFPVEVHSANLLYDGQDAMVAVARDLSARHDAEVRYNSLIEGIDKAITLQDRQGRVHYMNAAASRIYGIGGDESIHVEPDWNDWLVVDEDGRFLPFEAHPASRALATGQAVSSQVLGLFRRSTQRLLWLSVTAVPQFAPGADQADMVLTLSSDITELQRDKALFDRVQELAQIEATLPAEGRAVGEVVPVQLRARVTEIGTLELLAQASGGAAGGAQWKVEFDVRGDSAAG